MAERRMFAKTIVTSDAFLDMPPTARCLYFTLAMFADDDGFVNNPKSIMRQVGSTTDDMNILITKKFVLLFESGVIVIKHWKIHNYIRGDRKHETKYVDEMALLDTDEKGAYTMLEDNDGLPKEIADAKTLRQQAYAESELPYSFDYKIKRAFWNTECPVCGKRMTSAYLCQPTIQHNKPISKGGKHELGNISVICQSCNASIRDKETDSLNAEQVIEEWERICQADDGQMSGKCHTEVSIGKDSLGEISQDKEKRRFTPPTLSEVQAYVEEKGYHIDAEAFIDFYESKGWMVGKNKMKDWKASVRTWEKRHKEDAPTVPKQQSSRRDLFARLYEEHKDDI